MKTPKLYIAEMTPGFQVVIGILFLVLIASLPIEFILFYLGGGTITYVCAVQEALDRRANVTLYTWLLIQVEWPLTLWQLFSRD